MQPAPCSLSSPHPPLCWQEASSEVVKPSTIPIVTIITAGLPPVRSLGRILLTSKLQPKAEVYPQNWAPQAPSAPNSHSIDHFHHQQHIWVILGGLKCYRILIFKLPAAAGANSKLVPLFSYYMAGLVHWCSLCLCLPTHWPCWINLQNPWVSVCCCKVTAEPEEIKNKKSNNSWFSSSLPLSDRKKQLTHFPFYTGII